MSLRDDINNAMRVVVQNNLGKWQRPGALGELQVPVEIHAPEERLTADPLADDGFRAVNFAHTPDDGSNGGMGVGMRQPEMKLTALTPEGSEYAASLLDGIAAKHQSTYRLGMDSPGSPDQGFYQPAAWRGLQPGQSLALKRDASHVENPSSAFQESPQKRAIRNAIRTLGLDEPKDDLAQTSPSASPWMPDGSQLQPETGWSMEPRRLPQQLNPRRPLHQPGQEWEDSHRLKRLPDWSPLGQSLKKLYHGEATRPADFRGPPAPRATLTTPMKDRAGTPYEPDLNDRYNAPIIKYAEQFGVDPMAIKALISHESEFNPKAENGSHVGLGQLSPQAAKDAGIDPNERTNPERNIYATTRYVKQNLDKIDRNLVEAKNLHRYSDDDRMELALAAYNAGPDTIRKALNVARAQGVTAPKLADLLEGATASPLWKSKPAGWGPGKLKEIQGYATRIMAVIRPQ